MSGPAQRTYSWHDLAGALLVFGFTFVIFRISPQHSVSDSRYTMFFSQQLLRNHTISADAGAFPEIQSEGSEIGRIPYQLVRIGNRLYDFYPPGSAMLSMPYVAFCNLIGVSAIDQNGVHDKAGENRIQAYLAALLMAGLSAVIFLTSRLVLWWPWSLLLALATAFGTQVWSTASRAVWSQTWGIFVLAFAIWLIFGAAVRKLPLRPMLLATCLSWLYFVRPTYNLTIVAIAVYVFVYHRKDLIAFVLAGGAWLAVFIGYSEYNYGSLLPPYYQQHGFRYPMFWESLARNLVSPSRGLFVFVPVLFVVIYLLVRYRTQWTRLLVLSVVVIVLHLSLVSLFGRRGGHCYGPRLMTDLVPWLALLGMLAVEARLRWGERNPAANSRLRVRAESAVAAILLAASIWLNGVGAWSKDAWRWNVRPTNINDEPQRIWDWKHPQFLGSPRDSKT